jgi:hypothetical protein
LSAALVARYDEAECFCFVRPVPSGERGGESGLHTFEDRDGVVVSAFLAVDQDGHLRELDLWKADDSPIVQLPDSFT